MTKKNTNSPPPAEASSINGSTPIFGQRCPNRFPAPARCLASLPSSRQAVPNERAEIHDSELPLANVDILSSEFDFGQPSNELSDKISSQLKERIRAEASARDQAAAGHLLRPSSPRSRATKKLERSAQLSSASRFSRVIWATTAAALIATVGLIVALTTAQNSEKVVVQEVVASEMTLPEQRNRMLENPPADLLRFVARIPSNNAPQSGFGDIVWSQALQDGFARLSGLEENIAVDRSKKWDYSLFIFSSSAADAKPIEAASFDVFNRNKEIIIQIKPNIYVKQAVRFAVSPSRVLDSDPPLRETVDTLDQTSLPNHEKNARSFGGPVILFDSGISSE